MQQAATVAAAAAALVAAVAVALLLDLIYACQCFMIEWGAHTAKQRENDRENEREKDRDRETEQTFRKKEPNSTHKYVFILHAASLSMIAHMPQIYFRFIQFFLYFFSHFFFVCSSFFFFVIFLRLLPCNEPRR